MVSPAAGALADRVADMVTSTRQTKTPTNTFKVSIEDKIQIVEEQLEVVTSISKLSASDRSRLDSVGTELWNACRIQVREVSPDDKEAMARNSRVLVVAVGVLDLASPINAPGHIRILEVAFEASRVCMDSAQLDNALKILKVAAKRLDSLVRDVSETNQIQLDTVSAEYYMLRVQLAWQQGRPDVSNHLFTKIPLKAELKNRCVIMEGCLSIGRSAVKGGQYNAAVKWLEVALDQLHEDPKDQGLDSESFDLHVRHALAWAYMRIDTTEAAQKLGGQMTVLKTKYAGQCVVQFIELEIIRRKEKPDCDHFFQVLGGIIAGRDYTEEFLNVMLGYIKYSIHINISLAFEMYKSLLKSLTNDKPEWVEECFLRLPLMVNSMAHEVDIPNDLYTTVMKDVLACLQSRGIESLSQEANHVFFTILLNMHEDPRTPSHRHIAENWCHVILGAEIFKNCCRSLGSKLQKKLAMICFNSDNVTLARQVWEQLDTEDDFKSDPQIQSLGFKLALHDEKDINLKDYIHELSNYASHSDQLNFLRSCAVEADKLNNSKMVIDCVQEFMRLADNLESSQEISPVAFDSVKSLSMGDLYTFPLSVLSAELGRGQTPTADRVLHLTYSVLRWATRGLNTTDSVFSVRELESICMDSYNLTLHIFNTSPPESAAGALELTKETIDFAKKKHESTSTINQEEELDKEIISPELGYIAYQFLYLEVSIRALHIESQTDSKTKLEQYTKITEAIRSIHDQAPMYSERHPLDADTLRNLSANEFEAAVALNQWSAVATIIRDSESFHDAILFDHFINCIVNCEMPDARRAVHINTMLEIIRRAGPDIPIHSDCLLLSYHHLFTSALAAAKSKNSAQLPDLSPKWPDAYHDMAEAVIDEVLKAASSASASCKEYPESELAPEEPSAPETGQLAFPIVELGYLATSSFNQAMDFYSAVNDQACLRWARKAVLLAESMRTSEGEELVSLFQSRLERLF